MSNPTADPHLSFFSPSNPPVSSLYPWLHNADMDETVTGVYFEHPGLLYTTSAQCSHQEKLGGEGTQGLLDNIF